MTRAPAALALLLVASASRNAWAEPCAARAELSGGREAVERVGAELVKLGVELGAGTARCPGVRATVELAREDGSIEVAVRGSGQRSEGRVLTDPSVAAAWIDAWLRDDLDVAGWAPEPAVLPPSAAAPRDVVPSRPVASGLETLGVAATYEQAWTDDDTAWRGASLGACVRFRGLCVGARARVLTQPDQATNLSTAARSDLSLLATASLPMTVGQIVIAPELGVGIGRFATRRVEACDTPVSTNGNPTMPGCDGSDPTCVMPPSALICEPDASGTMPGAGKFYIGDKFSTVTYTPRLALALRISVSLFRHVWLDGAAAYTLMPFGHGDAFVGTPPPGLTTTDVALPGEPASGLVLGVGLRVGAR